MTAFPSLVRRTVFAVGFTLVVAAQGKPPASSKEEKKPTPTPAKASAAGENGPASFLRWLLLQNGGPEAITISWPELVRASTGKEVVPLDLTNSTDAAVAAKYGAALDAILPQINRRDGSIRGAALLTSAELSARIAEDLRTALAAAPATEAEPSSRELYPAFRYVDTASGRSYYCGVIICLSDGRGAALRALNYRAKEASKRITADGGCLLVVIEHNGKAGSELTFLNWELLDLAKVSMRCAVGFEADENALHQPGAVITDGRKGRD